MLLGRPMVYYTIKEAFTSECTTDVVVATYDDGDTNIPGSYNVLVDERSYELCCVTVQLDEVVDYIAAKYPDFTFYLLLQPTSPTCTFKIIDDAITLFIRTDCNSDVTLNEVEFHTYYPNGSHGDVNKDIPPNVLAFGMPVKIARKLKDGEIE